MDDHLESFPVASETDKAILMHRDVHFGGKFEIMLDYYQKEGKGAQPDFEPLRILELKQMEQDLQQNLAAVLLSGADAEKVAQAKEMYKKLRKLYENASPIGSVKYAKLIADLILSEEEEPELEIAAIVAEKGAIVPALMELLRSEESHDPLFPGYGLAPALATKCLGLIGDKRAIIALYESIGNEDFFNEDLALEALRGIGEPAKAFLLKVLHGRPLTFDNERAAMALIAFKEDPEVSEACFKMLKELDMKQQMLLATYLVLACENLDRTPYKQEFMALADSPKVPSTLRRDIQILTRNW